MSMFILAISCLTTSYLPGPNIPGSCAILLFTALDFASITSHIHNWVVCLFVHLFLASSPHSFWSFFSILLQYRIGPYRPGEFIFQCHIFFLCILFMGFSRQEYWSGLPFPSPVDHILSELSTMTRLSLVALHSMAHGFIELDKPVDLVIRLASFLWLWLSVCLPSDGEG